MPFSLRPEYLITSIIHVLSIWDARCNLLIFSAKYSFEHVLIAFKLVKSCFRSKVMYSLKPLPHIFLLNNQLHGYYTRTLKQYYILKFRTNIKKFSILYQGPKIFNSLPADIQSANTLPSFSSKRFSFLSKTSNILGSSSKCFFFAYFFFLFLFLYWLILSYTSYSCCSHPCFYLCCSLFIIPEITKGVSIPITIY